MVLKKIFFLVLFNSCLFLLLVIGIQNSSKKSRVDFIINETVKLPIGFIFGASFIGGSITGSLISMKLSNKDKFPS